MFKILRKIKYLTLYYLFTSTLKYWNPIFFIKQISLCFFPVILRMKTNDSNFEVCRNTWTIFCFYDYHLLSSERSGQRLEEIIFKT